MTCPAEPTTPSPGSGEGFRSREIYGIGLYVLSVFCFCSMDVVGKLLLERHEPLMVVWARYASQGFWAVVIMAPWLRTMLRTSQPGLQVVRALMPFGTSLSFFYAIQHMQTPTFLINSLYNFGAWEMLAPSEADTVGPPKGSTDAPLRRGRANSAATLVQTQASAISPTVMD